MELNTTVEKSAIEKLILSFPKSLKAADISKVLRLFSSEAIVMLNDPPPVKGSHLIQGLFENLFKMMTIDIKYIVDEVIIINEEIAYVITYSKGNYVLKENGENIPVDERELFVVHKDNGEWKITQYIGNHN